MQHDGGGYTASPPVGQKAAHRPQWFRIGCFMSRSLVTLIIVLVVVIGGLFWLAGRDTARQPAQVEKVVPLANLQNAATAQ
ncbi:hypothetical protein EAH79_05195 [Sphingomonas koreensis]|nr:hypothetical protein EAH79_05195 [Sphingomonas koreensis]